MRLFARLAWGKTAAAIDACLGPADGTVGVLGAPALARLLGERRQVVTLDEGVASPADLTAMVVADADATAEPAPGDPHASRLRDLSRQLPVGGRLILLVRGARTESTRRALCAGLVDLEQRSLGGRLATLARTR